MECRGSGALLITLVLLVLGATLLPEPCDAAARRPRNPVPEPRCPNCARDCPQSLAGDSISEINEDYQPLTPIQYAPPGSQPMYDTLQPSPAYNSPQSVVPYNPPSYNSPMVPAVSYTPPLPSPSYDPRLPPSTSPEAACYNCPPAAAPASFNLLSKAPGGRFEPWRRPPRKYNRSPYAVPNFRPRFHPQETSRALAPVLPEYDCECGCEPKFQAGDSQDLEEDGSTFGSYSRRSSEAEVPRVSRHYKQAHQSEVPSPPTDMYKTYMPYVREEVPGDQINTYDSDESDRRGRERLYVVYRADAMKPSQPTDDNPITEGELETVIRKAMEIARQQRNEDNMMRKQIKYQQQQEQQQQEQQEQQQQMGTQRGQRQSADLHLYGLDEVSEVRNPGLDQSKWIAIKAVPRSDDLEDVIEDTKLSQTRRPADADLVGDMEVPQTVTESTAFIGPINEVTTKKS